MAGSGCNQCSRSGYTGRVGVFEILEIGRELADALRDNDPGKFGRAARSQPGFRSLVRSALDLAVAGRTTIAEVMALASEEEEQWEEESASAKVAVDPTEDRAAEPTLEEHLVAADAQSRQRQENRVGNDVGDSQH